MTIRIFALAILTTACVLMEGCAYVNFQRQYQVTGISSSVEDTRIGLVVRDFFTSRGLKLKRQYVYIYPSRSYQLVFTPPPTPNVDRREADLRIGIADSMVIIEQSEWFFTPGSPPRDYVESVADDLRKALQNQFGDSVALRFVSKSYY